LLSLLGLLLTGFFFLLIRKLHKTATHPDIVQEIYEKFCVKLQQIGISRDPAKGPVDFAEQIRIQEPAIAMQVDEIIKLYIKLRYSNETRPETRKQFQDMVRRFDPKIRK